MFGVAGVDCAASVPCCSSLWGPGANGEFVAQLFAHTVAAGIVVLKVHPSCRLVPARGMCFAWCLIWATKWLAKALADLVFKLLVFSSLLVLLAHLSMLSWPSSSTSFDSDGWGRLSRYGNQRTEDTPSSSPSTVQGGAHTERDPWGTEAGLEEEEKKQDEEGAG